MADEYVQDPRVSLWIPHTRDSYQGGSAEDLVWASHISLKGEIADQSKEIADHGGQLKAIPALAAAIQSNFQIWFAAISLAVALLVFGFGFLASYEIKDSSKLDEHTVALSGQTQRLDALTSDVRDIKSSVQLLVDRDESPRKRRGH